MKFYSGKIFEDIFKVPEIILTKAEALERGLDLKKKHYTKINGQVFLIEIK